MPFVRGHRSVFPRTPRNTGVYTRHPTFCHSHEWRVDTASGLTLKKQNACLHAVRHAVGKKIACIHGLRSEGVKCHSKCRLELKGGIKKPNNTFKKLKNFNLLSPDAFLSILGALGMGMGNLVWFQYDLIAPYDLGKRVLMGYYFLCSSKTRTLNRKSALIVMILSL